MAVKPIKAERMKKGVMYCLTDPDVTRSSGQAYIVTPLTDPIIDGGFVNFRADVHVVTRRGSDYRGEQHQSLMVGTNVWAR